MAVLVLDRQQQPVVPYSGKRVWLLQEHGRAWINGMVSFTIRLVHIASGVVNPSLLLPQRRFGGFTAKGLYRAIRANGDGWRKSFIQKGGSSVPPRLDGRGLGAATQR